MKKILVIAVGWMGDTLMLTPTIRVLREKFKSDQIDAITGFESSFAVLKNNPNLNKVYFYPFLKKGYLKSLFYLLVNFFKKYNISITFYPSYRRHYHIVAFLINSKKE